MTDPLRAPTGLPPSAARPAEALAAARLLLIFDCDGVLIDSEPIVMAIQAEHMRRLGIVTTVEQVMADFVGLSEDAAIGLLSRRYGGPLPQRWLEELGRALDDGLRAQVRPVVGAYEMLAALPHPKCVASNAGQAKIRTGLTVTGLVHFFGENLFSARDVAAGKPAPDVFLHAARSMGFAPHDCIVIEDSRSGIAAARAAGMTVFAYSPASGPDYGADSLMMSLSDRKSSVDPWVAWTPS